jgi:hypothetical protein
MSNFATYNTQISQKIANTSEVFYDEEMKMQACNDVVRQLLQQYDIPEMTKKATITFNALGVVAKPSDYFRMIKLYDVDSNGVETDIFNYIETDKFDKLGSTAAHYWTEDYDILAAAIRLKCKPIDAGTLYIRYVKSFTEMTDTSTDCGLSTAWDEVVAFGAASRLYNISGRYDEAREMDRLLQQRTMETYGALKNPGGYKQNSRLKSKWERQSLLGGFSVGNYDNTN